MNSLITMGNLRPGNVICGVGDGEGKELYSLLREPSLKKSSDMHKSHLWSRDPWLANVANGHQNRFEKRVRFPWGYSENL